MMYNLNLSKLIKYFELESIKKPINMGGDDVKIYFSLKMGGYFISINRNGVDFILKGDGSLIKISDYKHMDIKELLNGCVWNDINVVKQLFKKYKRADWSWSIFKRNLHSYLKSHTNNWSMRNNYEILISHSDNGVGGLVTIKNYRGFEVVFGLSSMVRVDKFDSSKVIFPEFTPIMMSFNGTQRGITVDNITSIQNIIVKFLEEYRNSWGK